LNASDDDDARLVARCRAGDGRAWDALVQRYQRLVYVIVGRGGLDEHAAADVFQTVFTRLVQHLPRLTQPDRLQAWIVTTAKRELWLASQRGRRSVSLAPAGDDGPEHDLVDETPGAEDRLAQWQELNRLRAAMDRLDERCRRLIGLLFRDEDERVGYDEVARSMAMPVGSIGPTRARCLAKLRQLLHSGGRDA
jgi:RNA polymerase sigma factor (sigma-70 family)